MRIGIDARPLETGHRFRGIGIYGKNLLINLANIDKKNQYQLFTQQELSLAKKFLLKNNRNFNDYQIRKARDPKRYYWLGDQFVLPISIKKSRVDVVHFLDQLSAPLIKIQKTIITINDLFQIADNNFSLWKNKIKLSPVTKADYIIAISQYVKEEIIKKLRINPKKIGVVYDGYGESFRFIKNDSDTYRLKEKYFQNKNQKYLIYIGSFAQFEKRKNVDFLAMIFRALDKKYVSALKLLMVGKSGSEAKRIKQIFENNNLGKNIIFSDFIPEQELVAFLHGAEALLFPSLAEGFGLPVLEAMACGCPVISSNTSSLPEIVGQAGILLNPSDAAIWAKKIQDIIENNSYRQNLINLGLSQAKKFSWRKCAQQTSEIYKKVYDGRN